MAGQSVLSAFMQALFEKLITAAMDEFKLLRGVSGQLQSLTFKLSSIQALLEDAEEKQLKDKSVRHWLAQLKDLAYEVDDLLDECAAKKLRWEIERKAQRRSWKIQVSGCCFWSYSLYHYNLAHRVQSIQNRLDNIARERDNLGLQVLAGGASRSPVAPRRQTSSLVDDLKVFGREEDRDAIVDKLLFTNNSSRSITILPIVGMGGLGKTTLVKSVYNDHRIKEHFQLRIWVSVSENFDETKLTKDTLEGVSKDYCTTTLNMNLLQEDLSEQLQGKRFLLVLDDVWNEDPIKWYRYKNAIIGGERGSKVIVTTRNENVGQIMGGCTPYKLKRLSDDDCWNLFRNYAFLDGNSSIHPHLEKIGKMIVKKLKGLPLAAKALGSLLYSKFDEEDWKNILRSEIWELPPEKNSILPALRLSYEHLPPHLKQCFAVCSVFHKDYIFKKYRLIKIWMALGLIQPQGGKRMEDIGSSYFDELVSRSFFQSHKGNYVMHDAIHDIAQSLSTEECHQLDCGLRYIRPEKIRHLSFSCADSMETSFEKFFEFQKLRTLLLLHGYKSTTSRIPDDLFLRLTCLRVLDLHRRDIEELPDSIGNLIQLRYLDLRGTDVKTLPDSVCKLYNLQTLVLNNCNFLSKMPDGITNLINLRHLEANTMLISQIAGIGGLKSLQELEQFIVRKDKGYKITELKDMKELRGHLSIHNLENVMDRKEASEAKLYDNQYLKLLSLEWTGDRDYIPAYEIFQEEEVLEALRPHLELKELKIIGYAGAKFPSWLGNPMFFYLDNIYLFDIRSCKLLPPLGQLPLLRYLYIGGLKGLVRIGQEFVGKSENPGFPSLIDLVIEDLPDLEEWICYDKQKLFPCLSELGIVDCPKLQELPPLPPTVKVFRLSEVGVIRLPEPHGSNFLLSTSLSALNIYQCPNLVSLQQGLFRQQLRALVQLTITDCEELNLLPPEGFYDLVSLERLSMNNCPNLDPLEHDRKMLPSSIKDLQIRTCPKLINRLLAECKGLTALEHLRIADCTNLHYFPEEGLPITLESFGILCCNNLQILPSNLKELTSLKSMVIIDCHEVQYLPQEGLPMNLQELYVRNCPLLKELPIPRVENDDFFFSAKKNVH